MNAPFTPNARLPDPCIEVLDERFLALRLLSGTVERLATGFYWAEGPVWFGDGRYLLFSDIPNNRILRWDDAPAADGATGATDANEGMGRLSEFRMPSNHANGLARDTAGRLLTCEHGTRRVARTEYDGRVTVLAERYKGKRLNSPNDIVCQMTGDGKGAVWFTDPPFGILGWWEGEPAEPELPHGVYRIDPMNGELTCALDDLAGSNGLAFSPDEKVMYVVESRAKPHRVIWAYDVAGDKLLNKRLFVSAEGPGAYDGMAVDVLGNVWCGFGSDGSLAARPEELDGVRVYDPQGKALAQIHLPERCANVCFGGPKRNRLFMAASHSLYALHVNTRGAVA